MHGGIHVAGFPEGERLIKKMWSNTKFFKRQLKKRGFKFGTSETPIVPIHVGEAAKALEFSKKLFDAGVYAPAVGFPTVAEGKARLRAIVTATHKRSDLERACEILEQVAQAARNYLAAAAKSRTIALDRLRGDRRGSTAEPAGMHPAIQCQAPARQIPKNAPRPATQNPTYGIILTASSRTSRTPIGRSARLCMAPATLCFRQLHRRMRFFRQCLRPIQVATKNLEPNSQRSPTEGAVEMPTPSPTTVKQAATAQGYGVAISTARRRPAKHQSDPRNLNRFREKFRSDQKQHQPKDERRAPIQQLVPVV